MYFYLITEIIIVLIFVLGFYYGYSKGLFRLLVNPIRFALRLLISVKLAPTVGKRIIFPLISLPVKKYVLDKIGEQADLYQSAEIDNIPTVMRIAAAIFGSPEKGESSVRQKILSLTDSLVDLISTVTAFLLLMLVIKLLLGVLIGVADSVLSIGVLGAVNRFFGVIASLCISFLGAWVFVLCLDALLISPSFGENIGVSFEGGPLFRLLKEINPINLLLSF